MGTIQRIKGKECEHSWNCRTGCGILHSSIERIVKEYSGEMAEQVLSYRQQEPMMLFDFQYQLSVCKHCNVIQSVPVFKIIETGEKIVGVCQECGKKGELIDNLENTVCPVCHKTGFVQEEIGRWD